MPLYSFFSGFPPELLFNKAEGRIHICSGFKGITFSRGPQSDLEI